MSKAYIVAGLGFGDEGKGQITQGLCRIHNIKTIVRYNGGPQAGHNIVLADGRHHSFAQFGAGTFDPQITTHLSRYMMIEPYAMLNEAHALSKKGVTWALDNLAIDPECIIITPWHWMLNQAREMSRGSAKHGSCGMGVGECKAMALEGLALRAKDIGTPNALALLKMIKSNALGKMHDIFQDMPYDRIAIFDKDSAMVAMVDEHIPFVNAFYESWLQQIKIAKLEKAAITDGIVMEGAQGVLLDEDWGFAPHNTWSKTTFDNGLILAKELELTPVKVGVIRTYATRHGAGPFPTEDKSYAYADHNKTNEYQDNFRQGPFDAVMFIYALRACNGIDELALTHVDKLHSNWQACTSYTSEECFPVAGVWDSAMLNKIKPNIQRVYLLAKLRTHKLRYISDGQFVECVREIQQ